MHSLKKLILALAYLALICSAATGVVKPTGKKVIGYWGCYPGGLPTNLPQLQTALTKGYNVIIFAFYLVDATGNIYPDPGSIAPPTKSSIGNQGSFTYLISLFGGQNGIGPTLTIPADVWAQNMYNNFDALNKQYGFDGIDIDLENIWGRTGDQIVCGLRTFFKLMHNNGYVVSMAPQTTAVTPEITRYTTGSWNSYVPLMDTSIIDYVDIVAIQLYNNAVPMGSAAAYTNSLTSGFSVTGCPVCDGTVTGKIKVPASKLAHGWPSTQDAAPGGCSPFACPFGSSLTSMYTSSPALMSTAGVMTWAIEWDQKAGWSFINAVSGINFQGVGASNPATQAPVKVATQAPATQAPTQKSATQAPATQAPATQAPVKVATQAPATAPPVQATTKPVQTTTKCRMSWTQTLSSSWGDSCNPVSMYTVTLRADGPIQNFRFKLNGDLSSVWDAPDAGNGFNTLPSWLFDSNGKAAANTAINFGYIVNSNQPAQITVMGDPCL